MTITHNAATQASAQSAPLDPMRFIPPGIRVAQAPFVPQEGKWILTPQVAAEWIKRNTNNYRPFKPAKCKQYANDMSAGRWHDVPDPLAFLEDGTLCQGQHRIQACIDSGVAIIVTVAMGVQPEAVPYFDIGASRTSVDIVRSFGVSYPTASVAIGRLVMQRHLGHSLSGQSRTAIAEFVRHHPEIEDAAVWAKSTYNRLGKAKLLRPAPMGFACIVGGEAARELIEAVVDQEGLQRGTAAYALMQRQQNIVSARGVSGRETTAHEAVVICSALDSHRRGRKLKYIKSSPNARLWNLPGIDFTPEVRPS